VPLGWTGRGAFALLLTGASFDRDPRAGLNNEQQRAQ
jgi:hypothetical protein